MLLFLFPVLPPAIFAAKYTLIDVLALVPLLKLYYKVRIKNFIYHIYKGFLTCEHL